MRKTLSLFAILFCISTFAQNAVPPFINYQAVIRDAAGTPIAEGANITLNIKIFTNASTLTPVYVEEHSVTVPQGNIINLKIGTGNGIPPLNNFAAIPWNSGAVHYLISKDGNAIGSRAPFATVPYAFSSGNSGASTSYSPSANVSTTGNILDLTNKLSNTVSVGSNLLPNSKIPTFSADEKGRLTNTGEYSANMGGDIIGKLDSQFVAKLRGAPLSTIMPAAGQVLQFNSGNWTPANVGGSGPWSYNASTIFPSNNSISDKVAIGSGTATSLLDVKNSGLSPYTSVPVASFLNSNPSYNSQGVVSIANQAGAGAGLFVQNANSAIASDGVIIQMSNNGNTSDGLRSTNVGSGRAGNFVSTSATSTVETLLATSNSNVPAIKGNNLNTSNSPSAIGVYGSSSSTHTNSAGIFGEHKAAGTGVLGINTNTTFSGVHGVYGTTTGTVVTNSGVFGETGGLSVGVRGVNKGSGNAIQGTKPAGIVSGSAGRFEINENTNPSAALLAITQGTGAAVQAMAGTPSLSALSLHLMNGHIKSSGNITTSVAAITFSFAGNFTVAFAPTCVGCNDVRGEISFNAQTVAALLGTNFCEVKIPFTKDYGSIPVVVASPRTDLMGLHYSVSSVTQNDFTIKIYRPVGQTFPSTIGVGTYFNFSYYVME
jgi:hypothetical protein